MTYHSEGLQYSANFYQNEVLDTKKYFLYPTNSKIYGKELRYK